MKRDEHKDLTKPRVAESSPWANEFCFSQEQSLRGANSDYTLGHPVRTRLTEANSEPWEKEKYSFIKLEQLPASLIASSGSLWAKQHQNQQDLVVLVLPHACVWSWYRGTKSSVLQQVQSCALRPQGIAKSTQLTLVCKEEKLKFQPADNSMSPITTHQELQGLFCFKPTVF